MNPLTSISVVRHGNVHNPRDVYYGRLSGFPLSEEGIQQSQFASEFLSNKPLVAAFSSPSLRARQTAKIIITRHNHLSLSISQLLNETRSPFDGQPRAVLVARNWDVYTGVPSEYEQPFDVLRRVQKFVAKVRQKHFGQHIVAVTHGDAIAFMILWAQDMPITVEQKIDFHEVGLSDSYPAPASITTFTYQTAARDERPQLDYINPCC